MQVFSKPVLLGVELVCFAALIGIVSIFVAFGEDAVNTKLHTDSYSSTMATYAKFSDFYNQFDYIDYSEYTDSLDPEGWTEKSLEHIKSSISPTVESPYSIAYDDMFRLYHLVKDSGYVACAYKVDDDEEDPSFELSLTEALSKIAGCINVKYYASVVLNKDTGLVDGVMFYVCGDTL